MNWPLAFKAEIVLGLQLVLRHRAPRVALLLAATLVVLILAGSTRESTLSMRQQTIVLIAGVLATVAGSRVLVMGAPLSSVRSTASPWLLAPTGRLVAVVLFTSVPVLAAALIAIGARGSVLSAIRVAAQATLFATAVAGPVMALTPLAGASAAAGLGLLAVLFGAVPPSEISAGLASWPSLRNLAVLGWNALPLPWRASRWLVGGGVADPALLGCWTVLGLGGAALVASARGWWHTGRPSE
jgi:hypothetical protein